MKKFKNFFKKENKNKIEDKVNLNTEVNIYSKVGELVKESRIGRNLSIKDLSNLSKIPESTIEAIENNIAELRPKSPFIRSILLKLEDCLCMSENKLIEIASLETRDVNKKNKRDYVIRQFDLLNSWQGSILYFLILLLTLFILNKYFILRNDFIEFRNLEEKLK